MKKPADIEEAEKVRLVELGKLVVNPETKELTFLVQSQNQAAFDDAVVRYVRQRRRALAKAKLAEVVDLLLESE